MNILSVISYYYPALAYGGPAKVVYDLNNELLKRNILTVYTTDVWDEKRRITKKEQLKSGKNFRVVYFKNINNHIAYRYRIFSAFGMVWRYLREKENYEVIHIHDVFIIPQLLIAVLANIYHKPYIVSVHGVLDPIRVKDKSLLKRLILRSIGSYVLRRAGVLVATSEAEKEFLIKYGYRSTKTVFNGVSLEMFSSSKKFRSLRTNKTILLYVGKIHPLKGLDRLVASMLRVKLPLRLLIAGPDDGGKAEILKLINKRSNLDIHFLGYADEKEKAELFQMADLFVYPSLSEGFSISILEAMKYGLPVLITDACNFPDIVKYKAGIVVSTENMEEGLAKALKGIINNKESLITMGKHAKSLVRNKYSIFVMAKNIEKIYAQQLH